MSYATLIITLKGGPGSGNWGHAGRKGKRGGSAPVTGMGAVMSLHSGPTAAMRRAVKKPIKPAQGDTSVQEAQQIVDYGVGLIAPSAKAGLDNTPGWFSRVKAEVREEIVTNLATATGLSYDACNEAVASWADSSNDTKYSHLSMQQSAARVFGTELSSWQKQQINKVFSDDNYKYSRKHTFEDDYAPYSSPQKAAEAFIKTMYTQTQEHFKSQGIKSLVVYRGVAKSIVSGIKAGEVVNTKSNTLESWTIAKPITSIFGTNVLKIEVPVERILCNARTGLGCLNEYEYVVIGGNDQDTAILVDEG